MTTTTKDTRDLTPEDCERIVDLFMEYGSMLASKDEWDMDDNFNTTESLYGLYCEITGHGYQEDDSLPVRYEIIHAFAGNDYTDVPAYMVVDANESIVDPDRKVFHLALTVDECQMWIDGQL